MKKLNKKGFTLIELLAVIAILAILMLLVAPNILSMFNSGKKQAFITQYQRVWQAVETEYVNKSISGSASDIYCKTDNNTGCATSFNLSITDTGVTYCALIDNTGKVSQLIVQDANFYATGSSYNITDSDVNPATDSKKVAATTSGTLACARN